MPRFLVFLLLHAITLCHSQPLKIMSYNLRLDTEQDGINQWNTRKNKVFALLKGYSPDIFGVQEGLLNQLEDIEKNTDYRYVGVGRDDGKTKGEFSAIFYLTNQFKILDQNTFWLSETPDVPGSKNWDAAITRVCTWAKFQNINTGKVFFLFNTHFDHIGKIARAKSAQLIKTKIAAIADREAVIVTGDFNSEPTEPPFLTMMEPAIVSLLDAGKGNSQGTYCTFAVGVPCKRIDYIFHSKAFSTRKYKVVIDNDGKFYPSDHLPVMAEFKLRKVK